MIVTSTPTTAFNTVQLQEHSLHILTATKQKNTMLMYSKMRVISHKIRNISFLDFKYSSKSWVH